MSKNKIVIFLNTKIKKFLYREKMKIKRLRLIIRCETYLQFDIKAKILFVKLNLQKVI